MSRQWSARPWPFTWSDPLALSPIYAKARDAGDAVPVRIVTVPKDAITTRNGKQVVYVVENNKAHEVTVVTGNELKGQVIVKSGIAGTETLVNNPPQKIQDGSSVKIKS